MNKVYKKIIAYNPTTNSVSQIKLLTYSEATDGKASDDAFYDVYNNMDKQHEIVVGVSAYGNYYQLSPAGYGTYIKENEGSMKFINKGKMLVAVADYHKKFRIPYSLWEEYDKYRC